MKDVQSRLVRVFWELKTLDEVLKLTGDDDYGLYQVYAQHVVFGPGALVYIGKAVDQTFGRRFKQHKRWLDDANGVTIRIGQPNDEDYDSDSDWSKCVHDIEALTIHWHSPPYNSKSIQSYNGPSLMVQSWGDHGALLPEYSSHWKPWRPDDEEEK
jgi:hypothetical protein